MKFEEVLPALRKGKKIRKIFWWNDHYIIWNEDNEIVASDTGKTCVFGKEDFTCADWEIVEEKKKVKLRDLTQEQYRTFVDSECRNKKTCNGCLFYYINCSICDKVDKCWINHKDLYSDKFLDQEVEIDE